MSTVVSGSGERHCHQVLRREVHPTLPSSTVRVRGVSLLGTPETGGLQNIEPDTEGGQKMSMTGLLAPWDQKQAGCIRALWLVEDAGQRVGGQTPWLHV